MINRLVNLLLKLNHLIDCYFDNEVTVEEIDEHLKKGDLLNWLKSKFWGHFRMERGYRNACSALIFRIVPSANTLVRWVNE